MVQYRLPASLRSATLPPLRSPHMAIPKRHTDRGGARTQPANDLPVHTRNQQEVVVSENRITLTVTHDQRDTALAGIAQAVAALPGMVTVHPSQVRDLYHFVNKNELFARGVLRTLEAHPRIVPPSLDVAGARGDLDALDALRPVLEEVTRLQALLEGTVTLLGHDVMHFGYEGYRQLKVTGAEHGLEDLRRDIGHQFSKRSRRAAEEEIPQV
jgi:hypothetical protein